MFEEIGVGKERPRYPPPRYETCFEVYIQRLGIPHSAWIASGESQGVWLLDDRASRRRELRDNEGSKCFKFAKVDTWRSSDNDQGRPSPHAHILCRTAVGARFLIAATTAVYINFPMPHAWRPACHVHDAWGLFQHPFPCLYLYSPVLKYCSPTGLVGVGVACGLGSM